MEAQFEKIRRTEEASFLCYERVADSYPFQWHYHPEHEITLIVRSHGTRFVGDNIADYSDGDLVLLGPNLPHTWSSRTRDPGDRHKLRAVGIQFASDFLGERFFRVPEMRAVRDLLDRGRRGLSVRGRARQDVTRIMRTLPLAAQPVRLWALLSILERLSRAPGSEIVPLASPGFRPVLKLDTQARIDLVCGHINEHYTSPIEHAEVARIAHLAPAAFSRFFKRSTGKTMTDYVNELRVGLACRLLINSDLSVSEICYRVGFNNFSNFSRRFKRLKRVTPREFRSCYVRVSA